MSRIVTVPPDSALRDDGLLPGGWWHETAEPGRVICDLCPRACNLKPGDRGFCFVRENVAGEMMLSTYGRSTGFCIDPIEKKPLNHFYPGTSVLSFGTAGCNLGCKFCQNWDISKSREVERLSERATPEMIAAAAQRMGCHSVAFTYNDPVIWAEYAIDTARACRAIGVHPVAVSAGYITPAARPAFFHAMDAANIDLKAFTEDFYHTITYSHLQPVLDTLRWLKHESEVWFEITNLVIPAANDSLDEIRQMSDWILEHVGDDVPLHFSAFHPDFRMNDRPHTPHETLLAAQDVARRHGLKYVYIGNVDDTRHQSTYCPSCRGRLIERNWYELGEYRMRGDQCGHCGERIAGRFADSPGDWGRKRLPVRIADFAPPVVTLNPAPPRSAPTGQAELSNSRGTTMASTRDSNTTLAVAASLNILAELTDAQQTAIHRAACELIAAEIHKRPIQVSEADLLGAAEHMVMGAFVTAKRDGRLRACCGALGQPMTVAQALAPAARRTATEDGRMPPISPTELAHLEVEVTLLFNFQPVTLAGDARLEAVQIGRHGLQIRRGDAAGLLLPNVAVEHPLNAERFLQLICQKAGLPTTAWRDEQTQLVTFEGLSFGSGFDPHWLGDADLVSRPLLNAEEVAALGGHCQVNISAMLQGATPTYYVAGCGDGTVNGVVVSIYGRDGEHAAHLSQISLRPGMPMQATVFTMCEAATGLLRQQRVGPQDLVKYGFEVTLFMDAATNGTVAKPDLRGVDPRHRAILVTDNNRSCWVFDPTKSAEEVLQAAVDGAQAANHESALVFSCLAQSTRQAITITNVPRPMPGPEIRPAAVAGAFYPADASELNRLVDDLLGDDRPDPEAWPAVMVPHAGLIYSGRIAADVLKRVELPETVIVIGPKHTRHGVEWAAAPHRRWAFPGGELAGDPELALRLVQEIPGLELDAAAHQQEHAIEVELPLIARLNPQAKVVGIVLGGGSFERCQTFATKLAEVLRTLNPRPLLVISSDMNHFARDDENRRLDEIALTALEQLDAKHLYDTVAKNAISMCGVIPATIVLETLRQLGSLERSQRVAYATSADVTGDTSRVVGYAGMLVG